MANHLALLPGARDEFCFCLRITASKRPDDILAFLSNNSVAVFATLHNKKCERPHYHLAIYNCAYKHDVLRRKLNVIYKETVCIETKKAMALTKWDLSHEYLVYMLKGNAEELSAPVAFNTKGVDILWLSPDQIEHFRNLWVSNTRQENSYTEWKNSPDFPIKPVFNWEIEQTEKELEKISTRFFDTVCKKAIAFSLERNGGFVSPKVRFEAKDLISNYCLFNGVKMRPIYI